MHVVTINRPGMNDHLVGARRLTHQLSAPLPRIPAQDREPIFRNPYNVVLAVPDHMAAAFVTLHAPVYTGHPRVPCRLKGVGFPDPLSGTLKIKLAADWSRAIGLSSNFIHALPPRRSWAYSPA